MSNVFNLEFDVNTQQGQQKMEDLVKMQEKYADSLRQTVKETLGLRDGEQITAKQITQVQKLIQLERQRQQLAREDYRQAIQNSRTLSNQEKKRALDRLRDEEAIANARASKSDDTFSQGRETLIRQEQEAARLAQQSMPQTQIGHFEGAGNPNVLSTIAGASGTTIGSAVSLLAKGGKMAKLGIWGLVAGLAFGGVKKLWNAGMDRDEALQSVLAATQGRYAREPGAIQGSNNEGLVSNEVRNLSRILRNEGRYGSTRHVDEAQYFSPIEGADPNAYYFGRKMFDLADASKAEATNYAGLYSNGTLGSDRADQAVQNIDKGFLGITTGREQFFVARAMERARDQLGFETGQSLSESQQKQVRDRAYEIYKEGAVEYYNNWWTTQRAKDLVMEGRQGFKAEKGVVDGTKEVNKEFEKLLKNMDAYDNAQRVQAQQEAQDRVNMARVDAGLAPINDHGDRFNDLGMSRTEALKYISVAVQAMPNLRNINEEGYHLAMYSRAGFGEDEIAKLNKFFDSGQILTGGQIFSMLRREMTKSSDDLPAVRKYMEGFQQLLPQVLNQRATYSGAETEDLIATMHSIQESFKGMGTTAFSGAFLADSMQTINQSFKDKSNDWKEVVMYQANRQAYEHWVANPTEENNPFNPNSRNYNAALASYANANNGTFDFMLNNMMREGGVFDNRLAVKNINEYLGANFANNPASLLAAIHEIYTKTNSDSGYQMAEIIANQIRAGNYDLFAQETTGLDKSYLEIDPFTLAAQKVKADFEDIMSDIGIKMIGLVTGLMEDVHEILEKIA